MRTKPSRQLIDTVAPIYRQFLEGKAKNLKIENGSVVRTDFMGRVASLFQMTFGKRIALYLSMPTLLLSGAAGAGWLALEQGEAASWLGSIIPVAIAGGVASMVAAWYLVKHATLKPLNSAIEMANALASGDLQARMANGYTGEFGQLTKALGQLAVNLKATVSDIQVCASSVYQAANEIASGNMDLSQRTEQQASSLEETASSMEELTSAVKQNADNSRQADRLSTGSSEIALKGGQMMGDVMTTMTVISESSNKIASIISVIDGIAFQTNILALNAAVEAARAGEQGRGFAVVATEVRNLAQRSAAAAKEIKDLIDDSVAKVEDGASQVNAAGQTMQEIVSSIRNVANIMSEITAASQEQSSGIEQINQAITQMDDVTQQNAALVEEAAASAEALEMQSKDLIGAISIFKIGRQKSSVARRSLPSSASNRPISIERNQTRRLGKKMINSDVDGWDEF